MLKSPAIILRPAFPINIFASLMLQKYPGRFSFHAVQQHEIKEVWCTHFALTIEQHNFVTSRLIGFPPITCYCLIAEKYNMASGMLIRA